jgi:protein-tyrosine-phosphatase
VNDHILFVCTGNTCRSPMAACLFQALAGEPFSGQSCSAGLLAGAGQPASPEAIRAMAERGLSLQSHRARQLSPALVQEAAVILTMTRVHKTEVAGRFPGCEGKLFTLGEYIGEPNRDIADPFGMPQETYRLVANQLADIILCVIERMQRECGAQ